MENQEKNLKMNKWLTYSLISVLTAILILFGFLYLNNKRTKQTPKTTLPITAVKNESRVSITKDGFIPAVVSIKKGSQVTWTNQDSSFHEIASDPHPTHNNLNTLTSDKLAEGDSFTFMFENSGTYSYHDESNPLEFNGVVIVQ